MGVGWGGVEFGGLIVGDFTVLGTAFVVSTVKDAFESEAN